MTDDTGATETDTADSDDTDDETDNESTVTSLFYEK